MNRYTADPRKGPGEHGGSGAPRREPPPGSPSATEQARRIQERDEAQRRREIDVGVAGVEERRKVGSIPAV